MKFASVRLVTHAFEPMLAFYADLTRTAATRLADGFAEFRLEGATLAITTEDIVRRVNGGAAIAAANRSAILEFQVDDVDAVHARLPAGTVVAQAPTLMPWGNRSLLVRDPDGNLVNVFSRPVG